MTSVQSHPSFERSSARRAVALARTRRVVFVSVATQILETAALAAAAIVTGSSALVAQTFAAGSDIAVQVFLAVGVGLSVREPDETHPFGYGRERYFWSLFGALAVFVSGFAVAIQEALRGALSPAEVSNFAVGYVVLGVTLVLENVAFFYSLREVRLRARAVNESVGAYVRSTTEPATTTELIGNGIGLAGGVLATVALALTQATGSRWPDAIASGLIGIALMAAAVALTQQNRSLLTGRGLPPRRLNAMRSAIAAQAGVVDIPDLLAVIIGPGMLAVEGDVTFDDALTVPEVETALSNMETELRSHWPDVRYVYLTPVATHRPDREGNIHPGDETA
jgi:cation diffusion facilitator family transporter